MTFNKSLSITLDYSLKCAPPPPIPIPIPIIQYSVLRNPQTSILFSHVAHSTIPSSRLVNTFHVLWTHSLCLLIISTADSWSLSSFILISFSLAAPHSLYLMHFSRRTSFGFSISIILFWSLFLPAYLPFSSFCLLNPNLQSMFTTEDGILIYNRSLQLAFHFLVFLFSCYLIYLTRPPSLILLFSQTLYARYIFLPHHPSLTPHCFTMALLWCVFNAFILQKLLPTVILNVQSFAWFTNASSLYRTACVDSVMTALIQTFKNTSLRSTTHQEFVFFGSIHYGWMRFSVQLRVDNSDQSPAITHCSARSDIEI